jgi:hypothetical protein
LPTRFELGDVPSDELSEWRKVDENEQRFVLRGADLTRDDIDGQILLLAA